MSNEKIKSTKISELNSEDGECHYPVKADTGSSTFENFCWISASILVLYFSRIFDVILYEQTVYRSLMHIGFLLISVNVCIAVYLIGWVTMFKKIESDRWAEVYPWLIPIATGCFVVGFFLLSVAIWPYYSWATLPLLGTIFMGFITVITSFPNFSFKYKQN